MSKININKIIKKKTVKGHDTWTESIKEGLFEQRSKHKM